MIVLVQFSGRLLISVVGSKIENRFLITFNLPVCVVCVDMPDDGISSVRNM